MYAPEPTADAWHIEGAVNLKGGFTLGREIRSEFNKKKLEWKDFLCKVYSFYM
jgi:hypothetical protein